MDFRRSGPLDERRRRVLMDEIAAPADGEADNSTSGSTRGPVRAYHEAVLSQRQPKVTDLLPVRPLWVVVLLLSGLTGIAAIEAVHVHVVSLPAIEGAELLQPLKADSRGSLAAWYSSAMLAGAAGLAVVVFSIRAHRIDDYRGRYRIWLWTAAALTWLSIDAATGVHNSIGLGLTLVAGQKVVTTSVIAASALTWIAVYGLIFGTLGLRLVFELWNSRLGLSALLVAAFLYCDSALLNLEIIQAPANLIDGTLESASILLAHFSLLCAVGFYARHVLLDASGRLKVNIDADRKGKSKRSKLKLVKTDAKTKPNATRAQAATANTQQADAAPKTNLPYPSAASGSVDNKSGVTIAKNNLTSPDDYDDEDDEENYGGSNLSKSERRRLKKLARREQQRRAA